jgi:hypothetical protein
MRTAANCKQSAVLGCDGDDLRNVPCIRGANDCMRPPIYERIPHETQLFIVAVAGIDDRTPDPRALECRNEARAVHRLNCTELGATSPLRTFDCFHFSAYAS